MMRIEQIRGALNLYAPSSWDFRGETFPMSKDELQASHEGFVRGAKWADANPKQGLVDLSQVWHNVDEEPDMRNKHVYILYIDVDNVPRLQLLWDILEYHDYEIRWEEAVERSCIAKWAYMADLLLVGQYC